MLVICKVYIKIHTNVIHNRSDHVVASEIGQPTTSLQLQQLKDELSSATATLNRLNALLTADIKMLSDLDPADTNHSSRLLKMRWTLHKKNATTLLMDINNNHRRILVCLASLNVYLIPYTHVVTKLHAMS